MWACLFPVEIRVRQLANCLVSQIRFSALVILFFFFSVMEFQAGKKLTDY